MILHETRKLRICVTFIILFVCVASSFQIGCIYYFYYYWHCVQTSGSFHCMVRLHYTVLWAVFALTKFVDSISRMHCGRSLWLNWLKFKVTVNSQCTFLAIWHFTSTMSQVSFTGASLCKKEAQAIIQCQSSGTETWLVIPVLFTWHRF